MEIPPDLMFTEQRAARIAELRQTITRAWIRYAVLDAMLVTGPLAALIVLLVTGRIGVTELTAGCVAILVVVNAPLLCWTLLGTIRPAERELEALSGDLRRD